MPRRPRKARPSAAAAGPTDLARSRPTDRASALGLERARLLKEIVRRRKELVRVSADIETARAEMMATLGPLIEQQANVEREIHALFAALLAPGRLTKRQRAKVRNVYVGLQTSGLIEEGPAYDDSGEETASGDGNSGDDFSGGAGSSWDDGDAPAASRSAKKPGTDEDHRALRTLFKRLVIALHPDRAQDADEKARRTEAMKDVTRAYEAGDLARMIELGERFAEGAPSATGAGDPSLVVDMLERTVAGLKRQLREVLDAVRRLRRSDAFRAAKETERFRKAGKDPFAALWEEGKKRLDDLVAARDFVAAFQAGRTTFEEFLEGPSFPSDAEDEAMERSIHEVLEQFIEELESEAPRRPGRREKKAG